MPAGVAELVDAADSKSDPTDTQTTTKSNTCELREKCLVALLGAYGWSSVETDGRLFDLITRWDSLSEDVRKTIISIGNLP